MNDRDNNVAINVTTIENRSDEIPGDANNNRKRHDTRTVIKVNSVALKDGSKRHTYVVRDESKQYSRDSEQVKHRKKRKKR